MLVFEYQWIKAPGSIGGRATVPHYFGISADKWPPKRNISESSVGKRHFGVD